MKKPLLATIFLCLCLLLSESLAAQDDYKKYLSLSYDEILSQISIEYKRGAIEKALSLSHGGMYKSKQEFGEEDTLFANYCGWAGFLYEQTMQYDLALTLTIKSKNIREKMLKESHPDVAASIASLASLYENTGNYDLALPLLIKAKDIKEKIFGKEHLNFATSLNNIALLHQKMGNYNLALPLFTQAKDIIEKKLGTANPQLATILNNIALLHHKMGNYSLALPIFIQAKELTEKEFGKAHPNFGTSLNNLAALYRIMGQYDLALSFYKQAKDLKEKTLGAEHPSLASSLSNLAFLHVSMQNYNLALPLYIQAKSIYEKVLGREHPRYALLLCNLATLYQQMGTYNKAWEIIEQSMDICSGLTLTHNYDKLWMDTLKNVSYASNLHLEIMSNSLKSTYDLLQLDSSIENATAKQIYVADLAITLLSKLHNQLPNETDKLRILQQSNDWLQNSLSVLNTKEYSHKAFIISDQNKSVLLLKATKSELTYQLGELPDSLVWKDKKLLKKQSELQAKLLEKRTEEEKRQLLDELNNINQDIELFIRMMKKKYPKYYKLKYAQVDAKVEEIQALLDDKTALIEYVISDSILHIFKVTKNKVQWVQQPLSEKTLKGKIKALHHSLSDYKALKEDPDTAWKNYTESAFWCYQNLLEPVLKKDKNITNLTIVTDGELGHLPFETFLLKKAPKSGSYADLHYLLKDYNISYNYSATLWKENKEAPKSKNNGQILAMAANYELKGNSSIAELRLPTERGLRDILQPLPAARAEVEALQKVYKGYFAFDSLAGEKMIKKLAPDYAIVHLAMHGLLDVNRPMLSSLAFTEDGDSTESNFWQAHEISKMQLNAELVVLSACETGYGKFETGNGIASLARSFMYAGAPALVVSLWQVNDASTGALMQKFYSYLAKGLPKDEALRLAKLDYLKSADDRAAHPAFWSPFILIGDNAPVKIATKGGGTMWYILGAVGLLTLVGAVFALRRRKKQ